MIISSTGDDNMAMHVSQSQDAASYRVSQYHFCPKCHNPIYRVRRRFIDRLGSLFVPCHRYRCHSFGCHWEGNLKAGSSQ